MALYRAMAVHFGPSGWWPANSPFEVMVGAILTQNTAWANAHKAIENLKANGLLSLEAIERSSEEGLARVIRSSGAFNQKAKKLKAFVFYLIRRFGGSLEEMGRVKTPELREELLKTHGIGPETADTILLYAVGKPVFVIDAYTKRILANHGLIAPDMPYEALRGCFERNLEPEVALFREFHAQIVLTGKHFCRKRPLCLCCPLEPFLEQRGAGLDEPETREQTCLSLPC
jgi:endonuclease-3 related protein